MFPPLSSRNRRAAFLDRDGVINVDVGYVHRLEDFAFIPGSIDALRRLQNAGYLLVVVTNQSGIARGIYTEAQYLDLTAGMIDRLRDHGVVLDSVSYCPHLPDAVVERYRLDCSCRKPKPGMLQQAASELGVDLGASILIGDRSSDIEAGRAAGVGCCYLVRSGKSLGDNDHRLADGTFENLGACVEHVLNHEP